MIAPPRIGIVGGGGWLGAVITRALVTRGAVAPEQLGVSFRSKEPLASPAAFRTRSSQELADWADVLILSVRPQDWPSLKIKAEGKLVVSVMATVTLEGLARQLQTTRVVRAVPNVAAEISKSYTPWVAAEELREADRALVSAIFGACGTCDEVASEAQLDYLTGLTGSGPAYPALLAEALRRDAIGRGIPDEIAWRATRELIIGAGRMLETRAQTTEAIVEDFVSYRGIISAAIEAMIAAGFGRAIEEGMRAAVLKGQHLSDSIKGG